MILWLIRHVLYFRRALAGDSTPGQLALGCALGMILGLVPKGNLLAVTLTVTVLSLRLNLAAAMCSTLLFSLLSPALDPITHPLGAALLSNSLLRDTWTELYAWPLLAWTSFNNSVVLGNFVLGTAVAIPFYHACKAVFRRRRRPVIAGLLTGPVA